MLGKGSSPVLFSAPLNEAPGAAFGLLALPPGCLGEPQPFRGQSEPTRFPFLEELLREMAEKSSQQLEWFRSKSSK